MAVGELGIPNHFISRINDREQLIRKLEIIPVEVVVRNVAAGSICQRLGLEEGAMLNNCLVEFCLKEDSLGDPIIAPEHIFTFGWATPEEMEIIVEDTLRTTTSTGMISNLRINCSRSLMRLMKWLGMPSSPTAIMICSLI